MDGIANVARQQNSVASQGRAVEQNTQIQAQQQSVVKEIQQESKASATSINSEQDVKDLVDKLNSAMSPISTNLKFGVDTHDVFYVSVRESATDKLIRRFPAEQAQDFLPKMQEVSGILFDTKG